MYRTARGAFESFDETLAWSAQTLGLSNTWIFWRVRMPCCRQGIDVYKRQVWWSWAQTLQLYLWAISQIC